MTPPVTAVTRLVDLIQRDMRAKSKVLSLASNGGTTAKRKMDGYQSRPMLGQSGPLTGLQLFVWVNCKLGLLDLATVDVPPTAPQFPNVAAQNLVITNTGGLVAVKLTCPTDPGTNTVLRASPPLPPHLP